jgi:molybdopterin molybdotransferase
MVSAAEARSLIVDSITPVSAEPCSLQECGGRVLAVDVLAPHDVPLFDNSGMDGFALRADDAQKATRESPVELKLLAEAPAGRSPDVRLRPGTAIRIMTGAPVPEGADSVVEQEQTEIRNSSVMIHTAPAVGRNIRRRGEDIRAGSVVLRKGTRLNPGAIGVLASIGIEHVTVYRRPSVAVLTTGTELVGVSQIPGPGQIRNSNAYSLTSLLRQHNAAPVDLGIASDSRSELRVSIRKALANDALITSGGVSVGAFDLVLDALKTEGVEIHFWKVNIKPGMPMAFGIKTTDDGRKIPVFALPGNPVSSMVTFLQFVRPGLEKLSGALKPEPPLRIRAVLGEDIRKKDRKRHFVRGIARNENERIVVGTTGSQSSGVLTSMAAANCFIILPEEAGDLKAGDPVEIELL